MPLWDNMEGEMMIINGKADVSLGRVSSLSNESGRIALDDRKDGIHLRVEMSLEELAEIITGKVILCSYTLEIKKVG